MCGGLVKSKCEECYFFNRHNEQGDGVCMRHPPRMFFFLEKNNQVFKSAFPVVKTDWWCGEFKAK